ncbi:MAG: right-handed parallel beta-helix repeat-containing protein [Chitinivibrionales bacterium]|nr:right-handed parallel beta-helix repeat-containing protein [Chitinivibrionales bacterium]
MTKGNNREMNKPQKPIEFFVSPQGSDSWSGKLPSANKSVNDGPLATLPGALAAIRKVKKGKDLFSAIRVIMRGGHYFLAEPLSITNAESGTTVQTDKAVVTDEHPVEFNAYKEEKPVISGGREITGWREQTIDGKELWVTNIPEVKSGKWRFNQLYLNNEWRDRPRLPRRGFFRIADVPGLKAAGNELVGRDFFKYRKNDIKSWKNLTDVEVVVLHLWVEERMWIKKLQEDKKMVTFDRNSGNGLTDDYTGTWGEYYVENVFEELSPGEWYLDRASGTCYYYPQKFEKLSAAQFIAPVLEALVNIQGENEKPVEQIRFNGITFSHTQWVSESRAEFGQASVVVPAAITLSNARKCSFKNCTFANIGTYVLDLKKECREIEISRNNFYTLGAGAIKIWHGCTRNIVADNTIAHGGKIFHSGVAVLIGKSSGNMVLHNHIHHFYYTGISVGWAWGYAESNTYGNVIEYNHVHDIGQGFLSDMGCIYTLGNSQGTRIRFNVFSDVVSRGYGGFGIYTDEGSSDILIESNICCRTKNQPFLQHFGMNNIIQNNIFAFSKESLVRLCKADRGISIIFRNNILYFDEGDCILGEMINNITKVARSWQNRKALFEKNLYFDKRKKPIPFPDKLTFTQWQQKLGQDRGSIIADPLFVAPEKGDFRLKPGSPAFKLGFKEFDVSMVGPR